MPDELYEQLTAAMCEMAGELVAKGVEQQVVLNALLAAAVSTHLTANGPFDTAERLSGIAADLRRDAAPDRTLQ